MSVSIQAVLSEGFSCPVRDVLWGHIYFTPELAALTNCGPFARLHRILQLGPVYHIYPGATHTRASHSMGVYHLGRRLLQNLVERGTSDGVVSPSLSRKGVMSFLCACLLHDLGHFPYTHSLKELPMRSHESLTGEIILSDPVKLLVGSCGADPELTAAIIDKELPGGDAELLFYRKLLSGCFDPDKLDYLNRDARYCGVPYGVQDVDFILSRLIPSQRGVDIDSRLIPNVEAILFAKYLMYRTVYWHRQVRSATAMIKKALLDGLESGKIAGEELYGLDDQGLFALLREKTGSTLAESVREGNFYPLIAEAPFSGAAHACLKDIGKRSQYEQRLADEFRRMGVPLVSGGLIIDLPEPVSFETGLFVADEHCGFTESSSAFKSETLDSFVNTLYTVRIFINPDSFKKVETMPELSGILNGEKLWLRGVDYGNTQHI
ncbi:MAG: HD domain-containing protein [Treponema sp.]|jgi:HD superfamily phosphohydrolase|nr:HD domain-containing protein [Treponema sp.]